LLLNNLADFRAFYRGVDKRRIDREVDLTGAGSTQDLGAGLAAAEPTPSRVAMAHEQAEAVRRVLDRLPAEYRVVLLLRHQDELTFEEIGRRMERSAEAARKLWARAVVRLQRESETAP
jgi:RNA polymerase sigma-70 factor (ECF subfamily)